MLLLASMCQEGPHGDSRLVFLSAVSLSLLSVDNFVCVCIYIKISCFIFTHSITATTVTNFPPNNLSETGFFPQEKLTSPCISQMSFFFFLSESLLPSTSKSLKTSGPILPPPLPQSLSTISWSPLWGGVSPKSRYFLFPSPVWHCVFLDFLPFLWLFFSVASTDMASALHSFCTILTHSSIHLGFTKDGISAWYPSRHRDTAAKRTNKAAFTELTSWEVETEHKYVHKFKIR